MSHSNNDLEKRLSNISIGSVLNYLSNEDYKGIFQMLMHSRPDQLKSQIKEILVINLLYLNLEINFNLCSQY